MNTNEKIAKAAETAELLIQDLRDVHREFCLDKPTAAERIAGQHTLELLRESVSLLNRIKGMLT